MMPGPVRLLYWANHHVGIETIALILTSLRIITPKPGLGQIFRGRSGLGDFSYP